MNIKEQAKELVSQMTLEEKVLFTTGAGFWKTRGLERLGIPEVTVTDGPHGLRKQTETADNLGINDSLPSTCFPTASASACSFDRNLLYEMGESLGEKCLREDVAVILGPGTNMKRSPLCGRNFEYFSEDPYLSGELSAALINGVQSKGVGTSLKHFAANSQETNRMAIDSVVDERALREIYLTAFEIAVKKAQPKTVMCSYNKINGVYSDVNKWLLTDVLRKEWGFEGLVVSDWGAVSDKVEDIKSGMNLEMPGYGDGGKAVLMKALKDGRITEDELDGIITPNVELALSYMAADKKSSRTDADDNETAEKVAENSAVLLKNEDKILPFKKGATVAFIGRMAKKPRYQGAGSSRINPAYLDNPFDEAVKAGLMPLYAEGYTEDGKTVSRVLISEAVRTAKEADIVCIFAGLPDSYESEGFDRDNMKMPESHLRLIEAVAEANPNIVVVLQCGSPVELPFKNKVKGILLMYLAGQAGGRATVRLLTGEANPSGKLAETWPKKLEDNPSFVNFPGYSKTVEHRESIFIGYRYYDTAEVPVEYNFGYGLSYSKFAYGPLRIEESEEKGVTATVEVTNTGEVFGKEAVLLFVGKKETGVVFRAKKELKGFEKVELNPGETKKVTFNLDSRCFAYYNIEEKDWCIEGGTYVISVEDQSVEVGLKGDGKENLLKEKMDDLSEYRKPAFPFEPSEEQFERLLGGKLPERERNPEAPFDSNSTLGDIKDTFIGKLFLSGASKQLKQYDNDEAMKRMVEAMMYSVPLRSIGMTGALSRNQIEGVVDMANGKGLRGIFKMLKK